MREEIERVTRGRDAGYNNTTLFKDKGDQFARIGMIVYDQQTQILERAGAFEFITAFAFRVHVACFMKCEGKLHSKRCALSFSRTFSPHIPTMKMYEMLHNRQSEPQSGGMSPGRAITLTETVKNMRQKIGRYALACIADGDLSIVVNELKSHFN